MGRPETADRTVHAVMRNGDEIVRYDRAGKWYREWPYSSGGKWRNAISLTDAVELALRAGTDRRLGKPGGLAFDAKVRRALAAAP